MLNVFVQRGNELGCIVAFTEVGCYYGFLITPNFDYLHRDSSLHYLL